MRDVIPKHGKSHLPGGSDPIGATTSPPPPIALAYFANKALDGDGTEYAMSLLASGSMGGESGIADRITILNDLTGGYFRLNESTQDTIWAYSPGGVPSLIAYDALVYFASDFDGQVVIRNDDSRMGTDYIPTYDDPSSEVVMEQEFVTSSDGATAVHHSGLIIMQFQQYQSDTNANNSSALIMRVSQDSGSSQTITQGYVKWVHLGTVESIVTSP